MVLIWWFRLRYIVKTTRRGNVALTQNRAASFQATRRCRGLLWLAGWLPFLASIDPIGEALATATPNTFSHWLLRKCLYTRCKIDIRVCEITKYISIVKFQLIILIRELLIVRFLLFFFVMTFIMIIRWQ